MGYGNSEELKYYHSVRKDGLSLPFSYPQIFKCLLCIKMGHFSSVIRSVGVRVGEGHLQQVWEVR